jgi:hypothetical protein
MRRLRGDSIQRYIQRYVQKYIPSATCRRSGKVRQEFWSISSEPFKDPRWAVIGRRDLARRIPWATTRLGSSILYYRLPLQPCHGSSWCVMGNTGLCASLMRDGGLIGGWKEDNNNPTPGVMMWRRPMTMTSVILFLISIYIPQKVSWRTKTQFQSTLRRLIYI